MKIFSKGYKILRKGQEGVMFPFAHGECDGPRISLHKRTTIFNPNQPMPVQHGTVQ